MKVTWLENLSFKISQALETKTLTAMSKAAREWGKPKAAADICDEVLGGVSEK